jgi:hypothetical protein
MLFLTDINQICGESNLERPVTPKFKAWVRIHAIPNITYSHVDKFFWTTSKLESFYQSDYISIVTAQYSLL